MRNPELQASLERINDRNAWTVGWFLCAVVSVMAVVEMAADWHLRGSIGKLAGSSLILLLVVFPVVLIVRRRSGRPISNGWLLMMTYLFVMATIQAFGPLAHAR